MPLGDAHEKVDELNEIERTMRMYVPDAKLINKVLYRKQDPSLLATNLDLNKDNVDLQTLIKIGTSGSQA